MKVEKLCADTRRIVRETGVVSMVVGAAVMVAATGLATLVLKLLMP